MALGFKPFIFQQVPFYSISGFLMAATHILRPTCHSVQLMDIYPFEAMFLANLGRGEIRRFDYWEKLVL